MDMNFILFMKPKVFNYYTNAAFKLVTLFANFCKFNLAAHNWLFDIATLAYLAL